MDDKVNKDEHSTNKKIFFLALEAAWHNIAQNYLQNLVDTIPCRLQAVIDAQGLQIKY